MIVTSRDRWDHAPDTLDLLLDRTDPRHRIVVVDGAAPRHVAAGFETAAATGRVSISRHQRYLASNEARLAGLDGVTTDWIAFVENDVVLDDGWLDTLIDAAERTGAASTYPLYLEDTARGRVVHGAGCDLDVTGPPGRRRITQHSGPTGRLLADVDPLDAAPRIQAEPHAIVIRRGVLESMGGPDPELLGWFEHVDLALHHMNLGVESWFVPDVRCLYLAPGRFQPAEASTFLLRWGRHWFDHSLAHLCATWGLDPDIATWRGHANYRATVRRSVMTRRGRINNVLDRAAIPVERLVERRWINARKRDVRPARPTPVASPS